MRYLLIIFFLLGTRVFAQISEKSSPLSFDNVLQEKVNSIELPKVNVERLLLEDSLDQLRNRPMRFGKAHEVSISIANSSTKEIINDETKVWRLELLCPEAFSINLIYSDFRIPKGGKLFLYNKDRSYLLGAFTSSNNTDENPEFATGLIPGEKLVLEYNSPISSPDPKIEISSVIHGYKNFFLFGDSGPCNNNVNCPEGLDWVDQTNSVAMIVLAGGTRWCSGAMINNTCEDGTPYFLTANHCLTGAGVSNWMFYFNYQSPSCANIDGPTNQIVSGASLVATSATSDFALLELDSRPPLAYNVFYSGWSNINTSTDTAVAIHHPSGDIKKISFSYQSTESTDYLSSNIDTNETHWRIPAWDDGTTEGGSSGSPLFNTDKQIVGQLHGGYASCTNITSDWYGKFSYSWVKGSNSSARLSDWLDPSQGPNDTLGGNYFTFTPTLEASIGKISSPDENSCYRIQVPQISIRNKGTDTIASLELSWEIQGQSPDTLAWTGILLPGLEAIIQLDTINFLPGNYTLIGEILTVNGQADYNQCNNLKSKSFSIIDGNEVTFKMFADNWPEELNLEIADTNGLVLFNEASFQANVLDSFLFCLSPGCYDFTVYDSWGDGLTGGGFFNIEFNDSIYFTASGAFGNCTGSQMPNGCSVTYRLCLDTNTVLQIPIANFQVSDTLFNTGDTVFIQDFSGNFPDTWEWLLSSDSSSSNFTSQNVEFVLQTEGWYDISLKVSNVFGSDSIYVDRAFRVEKSSSLNSFEIASKIKIFPNPAREILNIKNYNNEELLIQLLNVEGQLLKNVISNATMISIDISSLPNGIYILKFSTNTNSDTRKIIIE
ncbi:T9SS type A sorting domain-containing protein [Hyphobacterium sp. CCMP332]|nr:T9SS type A sorting domain-containing protein [Hyphobacterium sp. CCMP332]